MHLKYLEKNLGHKMHPKVIATIANNKYILYIS